ncbi:hypothetical protein SELMODRAFT_135591 [Selaginella moellendorffii]|uniref:Conserved oligomeric Golgi complex subunit 7 n=1 Tax=Selaginella moellendorffii TaxID=88036 RepID=D8TAD2_SELML|nr:hypothetical protein SELMODRAFT_135591 [Selaginella moellendorffii]
MVDMAAFGEEGFDPKAWVNAACRARHPDEDAERQLSDLEMKLQLASEDIAAALEDQSTAALLRIPRALRDVSRLHDDALSLRSTVSGMLLKLRTAESLSAGSVAALSRVDLVKQRMEAAHKTLKDAAGLAQLCASVETVFASGNLDEAAGTLANMRRCLAVVGEVPEFASVKRELEALENRLDGMVQTRLTDALTQRKVESVQAFRAILLTIGRYNSLEQQYSKVRLKPLRRLWDEYESSTDGVGSGKPFIEWLPTFYDQVLLTLEQELKWCMTCFSEDYSRLISKLLIDTMSSIQTSFTARIEASITPGLHCCIFSQTLQRPPLNIILMLHNITSSFAKNVERLFSAADHQEMMRVLKAVYSPYEGYKQRYGELERVQLSSNLSSLDLKGAVQRSVGSRGVELSETVQRMESSVPELITFFESAVERCFNFTGGSEVEALLRALDETMIQYTSSLHEVLKSLRPVCGVSQVFDSTKKDSLDGSSNKGKGNQDMIPEEEEWVIVQGVLQLLTVAESLSGRLSVFEASLRGTLSRLKNQLPGSREDGANALLDIAGLRVLDAPDKARKLASLVEQATDPRFHALAHASQRVGAFVDAANELVYEVLISKVRVRLADVASMPVWSAPQEDNPYALPSFSAYPLPYVTSIGEYLLTLPQQLEPLTSSMTTSDTSDDIDEEGQYFATEWMFKVAEGATALYVDQIRGIRNLNERGAQQLSADIDYLCNVLTALSMNVPAVLSTFQQCVGATRDQLAEFAKGVGPDLDGPTVRLVCKMRQVPVE